MDCNGLGKGDKLVQAYNFRLCLTDNPKNLVPITKPDNYDPSQYELLIRLMEAQPDKRKLGHYFIWSRMPNRKTDVNNRGGFSTDMIGCNWNYPEASREERKAIIKAHEDYTKGLLYFVGHDERVPESIRKEMLRWGLPKDEYVEYGHWSPQLYIRESRRMIGEYVATQANCENRVTVDDGVGMAAYTMDSHNCQRVVIEKDGVAMVKNEGDVQTLRIPSEFRLNSVHVVVESSGDGILVRPVRSTMSVSDLFGMIDDARRLEGDLEIDRSSNVPSTPREIF
jgi:virulence-associated protein VagC